RSREDAHALALQRRPFRGLDEAVHAPASITARKELVEAKRAHVLHDVGAFLDAGEEQHVKIARQSAEQRAEIGIPGMHALPKQHAAALLFEPGGETIGQTLAVRGAIVENDGAALAHFVVEPSRKPRPLAVIAIRETKDVAKTELGDPRI